MGRGLRSAPAAERLPDVCALLVSDLTEQNIRDPEIVARAIKQIGMNQAEWPTTSEILAACRDVKGHPSHQLFLPEAKHEKTEESYAIQRECMRQIRGLRDGTIKPGDLDETTDET